MGLIAMSERDLQRNSAGLARRFSVRSSAIPSSIRRYRISAATTASRPTRWCETKLRKLARFAHVRQSLVERIMHGWSPQQIAGRIRMERHPVSVSHETIYKFAYSPDGHAIKLWRHLLERRARRRPRHARRRPGRRFSP